MLIVDHQYNHFFCYHFILLSAIPSSSFLLPVLPPFPQFKSTLDPDVELNLAHIYFYLL